VAVDSKDAVVELTRMYLQRVTEVVAHTTLEAIDNSEGTPLKHSSKYQTGQKLNQKM
jgi:hypothetical protein